MADKKECPRCGVSALKTSKEKIEKVFGYRKVPHPIPQSYCRDCRKAHAAEMAITKPKVRASRSTPIEAPVKKSTKVLKENGKDRRSKVLAEAKALYPDRADLSKWSTSRIEKLLTSGGKKTKKKDDGWY